MRHVSNGEQEGGRRSNGNDSDAVRDDNDGGAAESETGTGRQPRYPPVSRSRWWYLLPILLDVVGGIIAYFVLRHDDPPKAKNCLLLGIVLFVIHVALWLALPGW